MTSYGVIELITGLGYHCFGQFGTKTLSKIMMANGKLEQTLVIVIQNTKILIHKNAFENVICKMSTILMGSLCVNTSVTVGIYRSPVACDGEFWCFRAVRLGKLLNKELCCRLFERQWRLCDVAVTALSELMMANLVKHICVIQPQSVILYRNKHYAFV